MIPIPPVFAGRTGSVSEIEFRTPYVVAERWIVARMLRFMHAKNVHSDTLRNNPHRYEQWDRKIKSSFPDLRAEWRCN